MEPDRTPAAVADRPPAAALAWRPTDAWRAAFADAWRALWVSRAVVWVAGVAAAVALGLHDRNSDVFDPAELTRPFGAFGDALLAPAARWDAVWFLAIADSGYDGQRAAFFPLYPLAVKVAGVLTGSPAVGGVLVSLTALLVALTVLRRLVALDFGDDVARTCVLLVALFPASLFLSAIYSESLFLALSVGAIYAARTDRFATAGALGMLAAATRSSGLLLVVPLGLLLWRAHRAGRVPISEAGWLALVPTGLAAFCLALALDGGDALAPFRAQEAWSRSFAGPLGALPDAASAAWEGVRDIVAGDPRPAAPFDVAWLDAGLFACLLAVLAAMAGAVRRLPVAYWAYAGTALMLPLSYPADGQPLMSLPRFVAVLWPLHLWLALWLADRRPALRTAVFVVFGAGLAACTAEVATWGWIA
jgi:hypothetical protein